MKFPALQIVQKPTHYETGLIAMTTEQKITYTETETKRFSDSLRDVFGTEELLALDMASRAFLTDAGAKMLEKFHEGSDAFRQELDDGLRGVICAGMFLVEAQSKIEAVLKLTNSCETCMDSEEISQEV